MPETHHSGDLIDIKAWVGVEGGEINEIENITGLICWVGEVEEDSRLLTRSRESEILVDVVGVAAGLVQTLELCKEGFIEVEQVVVGDYERDDGDLFLYIFELPDAGIICQCAGEVEVFLVILVQHSG